MADWAIVIGIDRYSIKDATLRGAVRDAVRFREWLIDPAGGGLPEDHVACVLGPAEGAPDPGIEGAAAPDRDSATKAVTELMARSGGAGDRLFFYYSGHGLSARSDFSDEDAVIFSNFEWALPHNSLSLRSLWEYFSAFDFADQFLFVDACRNAPRVQDVRIGHWSRPRLREVGAPAKQQFILYATSPGLRATEVAGIRPGDERGAFTEALLRGLRGGGRAKLYDSGAGRYVVRWDSLASYVIAEMERERRNVAETPAHELLQIPQEAGTRGVAGRTRNPALVELPPDRVPDPELRLAVQLSPDRVVDVAEIRLMTDSGRPVATQTQLTGLPVHFTLPPRVYLVHAFAPQFDTAVYEPPVELYEDREITLDLQPAAEAAGTPPAAAPDSATVELHVDCADRKLPIELIGSGGEVLATGVGSLEEHRPPGAYRVRVVGPDGQALERVVELVPGPPRHEHLPVPAPEPAAAKLADASGLQLQDDQGVRVSEAVAPVGGANLSTLLGLAGMASLGAEHDPGHRLRELGATAMRELLSQGAPSGIHVLLGVGEAADQEDARRLDALRLSSWPLDAPVAAGRVAPRPFSRLPGVGEFAVEAPPGMHWLAIERDGDEPLAVPLAVLGDRVTLAVVRLGTDGTLQTFAYIPPRAPELAEDLSFLRQVELVERIALTPQLYAGEALARELVATLPTPPVAATLAAYLLLRLGHASDLVDVSSRLTAEYPELSDGYVLRAEAEAANGRFDAAAEAIDSALDAGIPVFGEGVTRLLDGIAHFRNSHERAGALAAIHARYVQGSLLTAWRPPALVPGAPLIA